MCSLKCLLCGDENDATFANLAVKRFGRPTTEVLPHSP